MSAGLNWILSQHRTLGLLATVAVGFCVGWFGVALPKPDAVTRHAASWSLPPESVVNRYSADEFHQVKASPVWPADTAADGGAGEASASGPSNWSLVGVVLAPEPYALVLSGQDVTHVVEGAQLPGGAVLKHVSDTGVSISNDGCTRTIHLFALDNHASPASCTSGAAPASAGSSGETHE